MSRPITSTRPSSSASSSVCARSPANGAAVVASLHDPNLALRFADRACLLSGSGDAALVDCDALDTSHLGRLYGLKYVEARMGAQRFMAPD